MKLVFMGTPDFAVPSLEKLIESKHEILAVVTQPDRKRDKCKVSFSPVKDCALKHGLNILQYEKISREGIEDISKLCPDIIITVAFGQMLSEAFLAIAPFGVINVHASLLPKYRGSSPIQWSVINGEKETGVSIMKTAYKMDSGDIILQKKTPIYENETAGELFNRLSVFGADALLEALDLIENGKATYTAQDHSQMTYFPMLKKESGIIDFSKSASEIKSFVLGMNPWPTAYTFLSGKMLKVFAVSEVDGVGRFGEVLSADKGGLIIACKDGAVKLEIIQPENGKRMDASAYLAGHKIEIGAILGEK